MINSTAQIFPQERTCCPSWRQGWLEHQADHGPALPGWHHQVIREYRSSTILAQYRTALRAHLTPGLPTGLAEALGTASRLSFSYFPILDPILLPLPPWHRCADPKATSS